MMIMKSNDIQGMDSTLNIYTSLVLDFLGIINQSFPRTNKKRLSFDNSDNATEKHIITELRVLIMKNTD
jgi:hypothetical protein